MGAPIRLREHAPEPTGVTRRWWVNHEQFLEVTELLQRIDQYQKWGMMDEAAKLREALSALRDFPHMDPGDHLEVRLRPRVMVMYRKNPNGGYRQ